MSTAPELPAESILAAAGAPPERERRVLGRSREGREIHGWRLGSGPLRVSLIGGCHADEPVGPAMLRRLVTWLGAREPRHPALAAVSWSIVPHVNPDGRERNREWSESTRSTVDYRGEADRGYSLGDYLAHVVREPPGDDVEFGFPRDADDQGARPENRAVAAFLAEAAPLHLHITFHGMSFAPGPWFLMESGWAERTTALREALRRRVRGMGYRVFDVDRRGEKGFHRIDEGFSTRPDSRAMAAHFEARSAPETAALFRPSSMETVRALGGDPLTLVSEMPLFLVPGPDDESAVPYGAADSEARARFKAWLAGLAGDPESVDRKAAAAGIEAMPIRDQMRLQLALLGAGLAAVAGR